MVTGAGRAMDGGSDMVMEVGRDDMAEPRSRLAVMPGWGRRQGGVSYRHNKSSKPNSETIIYQKY